MGGGGRRGGEKGGCAPGGEEWIRIGEQSYRDRRGVRSQARAEDNSRFFGVVMLGLTLSGVRRV